MSLYRSAEASSNAVNHGWEAHCQCSVFAHTGSIQGVTCYHCELVLTRLRAVSAVADTSAPARVMVVAFGPSVVSGDALNPDSGAPAVAVTLDTEWSKGRAQFAVLAATGALGARDKPTIVSLARNPQGKLSLTCWSRSHRSVRVLRVFQARWQTESGRCRCIDAVLAHMNKAGTMHEQAVTSLMTEASIASLSGMYPPEGSTLWQSESVETLQLMEYAGVVSENTRRRQLRLLEASQDDNELNCSDKLSFDEAAGVYTEHSFSTQHGGGVIPPVPLNRPTDYRLPAAITRPWRGNHDWEAVPPLPDATHCKCGGTWVDGGHQSGWTIQEQPLFARRHTLYLPTYAVHCTVLTRVCSEGRCQIQYNGDCHHVHRPNSRALVSYELLYLFESHLLRKATTFTGFTDHIDALYNLSQPGNEDPSKECIPFMAARSFSKAWFQFSARKRIDFRSAQCPKCKAQGGPTCVVSYGAGCTSSYRLHVVFIHFDWRSDSPTWQSPDLPLADFRRQQLCDVSCHRGRGCCH